MNVVRYLTFEINRDCPLAVIHASKCPIAHPERYLYTESKEELTDTRILNFWRWARLKGFRGIVLFHLYNEPAIVMDRIHFIIRMMKREDPHQPFQLNSAIVQDDSMFDMVKFGDYKNNGPDTLDNRLLTNVGEGLPYAAMPQRGFCGRGMYWEIPIDNYGNWCLCCNDWRNEESIGNIHNARWDDLYAVWKEKSRSLKWKNEREYSNLPRMCRSCLSVNPTLYRLGGA